MSMFHTLFLALSHLTSGAFGLRPPYCQHQCGCHLELCLGHPLLYPSPSRSSSSSSSNPHSSSCRTISAAHTVSSRRHPIAVVDMNSSSGPVALGSPNNLPSGQSSAAVGL